MSDAKKEIIFANSMTIDKRNPDLAYFRKNCFRSETKGLYPAKDFYRERPDDLTTSDTIQDILGSEEGTYDIKVITQNAGNLLFNDLGSNSTSNTTLNAVDYECGTFGNDGVKIVCDNDQLYKVQHANSNTTSQWTFTDARPSVAGFDGLYYWYLSNNEIYRQLAGATPTIVFNNIGLQPRFVAFLGDQMVIFCEDAGAIIILFWDKSDADLFDKRIIINNARLVAGGVVDGRLMLVKSIGNSSNAKEQDGQLVLTEYDGEKFVKVNAIKAGDKDISFEAITGVGIGSEVMVFSIDGNVDSHNTTLYKDFVLKVYADGSIEVLYEPDTTSYGTAHVVRVFYNFICIAQRGVGANPPRIWINEETDNSFNNYEDYLTTEYITNFLDNPYNDHQLDGLAVAFEKLFEQTDTGASPATGEELDVYYRVSERDAFTLLMNVTAQKVKENVNASRDQSVEYATDDALGLPEQRYMVTLMPDGTALPRFNEIQFKFVPKRGFSVIGAWYSYSYISRNTMT